jgi:exopolysaccharide production protein ExoY
MSAQAAPSPAKFARPPIPVSPPFVDSPAKRSFDLLVGGIVLLCALPAMACIAVLIRATSPGPIFFPQTRVGLRGRRFRLLKFRTMQAGASEEVHRNYVRSLINAPEAASRHGGMYKLAHDCRVTRVGRVLRRTGLDELPQLINVLRGEMSLVGPRPPLEYEVELYRPDQMERLAVRPGLTGLWQVSGRNQLAYADMCDLDRVYIRTWSFLGDVVIVLRTPFAMFHSKGQAA